jgi:membrane fusion protein (multidrug efflux system)
MMILSLVSCKKQAPQARPNVYPVLTVKRADCALERTYPASIQGKQDVNILPQVSGTIQKVCFNEGDIVKKGQPLFIIDQVPYQAALRTAKANVASAKAALSNAKLTYKSTKRLFKDKVVSQFDLTKAKNGLLTAKATLEQAKAAQVNAQNNLSYTVVKSPSNGVAGKIVYRAGTLVSPSMPQPLTVVADNSEMYVYFSMSEMETMQMIQTYGSLEEALTRMPSVKLKLIDGSLYPVEGKVASISGVLDASTGAVSVRAIFNNEKRILLSGGTGTLVMPYVRQNCITVPQSATFELQDKTFAYTIENGKAKSLMIEVERINDGHNYIVNSGLKAGDVIVAKGVAMLRNGMPIQPAKQGQAPQKARQPQK